MSFGRHFRRVEGQRRVGVVSRESGKGLVNFDAKELEEGQILVLPSPPSEHVVRGPVTTRPVGRRGN